MKILQVSADYFKDIYLEESITLLQKGEVICIPTDTLYSITTNPDNQEAVEKLYRIKKSRLDVPLTLIGSCKEEILPYVLDWTPIAEKLSQDFWPWWLNYDSKKII